MRYPGFGAIVSIVLAEGALAADLLTHKTTLWVHATSLGGVESTFERRRRWKSEPATIPDGLVRMSVGIEDVDDLWDDLAAALDDLTGAPVTVARVSRARAWLSAEMSAGEHVGGGHLALDDGVHGLDDRGVDVDAARPGRAATSTTSRPRRPGASTR